MNAIKIDDDYGFLDIEFSGKVYSIDCYATMELHDKNFPKDGEKPLSDFYVDLVRTITSEPELKVSSRAAIKIVEAISAEIEDEKKDEPGSSSPE